MSRKEFLFYDSITLLFILHFGEFVIILRADFL
ncbi:hypothetical protein ABID23_000263 [Bartonella silvatica]|uniref:Uncharacterized protein n=1 Tax=Bartonella silvatica TaxID=357760 RepID=A0ABV2HF64_9HYPH